MKKLLLLAVVLLPACASGKVSLRQIQEYDQGIKMAEKNGIDTTEQHKKLVEMMLKYLDKPGEDVYQKSARQIASAQEWSAAAQVFEATKPVQVYQPMPMSPDQYMGMSNGWFDLK